MNIVFINLAAYGALLSLGYRSSVVRSIRKNASISVRTGAYTLVVVLFVVLIALTSVGTYQHLAFEQDVAQEVQTTVDDPTYSSLELVSVQTEYNDMNVLGTDESVTVTVSRSTDTEYERLADVL